jgi:pimeloyl-ACP methyl ester carboxylesterase
VIALEYSLKYPERVTHLILMNPGPASREDYLQLRKDWLEKRPDAMAQRKISAETAAYKEGDPEAVTAYYCIHFKPALARPKDYEKLIARMRASFTKEGVLKARAVEDRLMQETWASPDFDLIPKIKTLKIPTLVLSGDHEFIPAATAEHIAQAIPGARLFTLKGCGHFTFMECPVETHGQLDTYSLQAQRNLLSRVKRRCGLSYRCLARMKVAISSTQNAVACFSSLQPRRRTTKGVGS